MLSSMPHPQSEHNVAGGAGLALHPPFVQHESEGARMQMKLRHAAITAIAIGGIAMATWALSAPDAPWQEWEVLRLRATSIPFFSGRLELRLSTKGDHLRFETRSVARFFGARIANTRTATLIDPATGRTERYESFSRKRGRRYTFGESSYAVERLLPPEDRKSPDARWVVHSRNEFDYPTDADGNSLEVVDYYGMLLQLKRHNLDEIGDEVVLHVATSKGPQPYRVMVSSVRTAKRELTDLRADEGLSLLVRELRLRIIPADPERADEGFLKMEGETELWVEAESKTPLLLSGKAPKIPGRIKLELVEIG